MKDRLWGGIIGMTGAILASIVLLLITGTITKAQASKKEMNGKLDIEVFEEYKTENKEVLEKYREENNEALKQYKIDSQQQMIVFKNHVDSRIDDTQLLIIELSKANKN